jgi:L-asparaginase
MASAHRMLLITTGGTIGGVVATGKLDAEVKKVGEELPPLIAGTISHLEKKHKITIDLTAVKLCSVDSSDILPSHWMALASKIKEEYDKYESFVITHGTNTLGYTCAALSFSLANPNKPIILTGSQVPAGLPGSDALTNLENAMRIAVWDRRPNPIKGVLAVFGSHIITGTRVKKDTEFDYDAFRSFGGGSVGRIGRIIHINEVNLKKHLGYLHDQHNQYREARNADELVCDNKFDMRIASLTEFPGMSSEIFQALVERNDVRGFILRAFGAGDPCTNHQAVFEYLRGREIPIVVTTQAPNGNANMDVNDPGKWLKDRHLAIPAYDMSIESQTTKLAWLLAKKTKGDLTYLQLTKEMVRDMRGELGDIWELDNEI